MAVGLEWYADPSSLAMGYAGETQSLEHPEPGLGPRKNKYQDLGYNPSIRKPGLLRNDIRPDLQFLCCDSL